MEYTWIIFLLLSLLFIGYWFLKIISQNKTCQKLKEEGYEHIFSGGNGGDNFIAFNIRQGAFRFGKLSSFEYIEHPISYLSNYEWKWNAEQTNNKFLFYISDVNHFMHEVFYFSDFRRAEVEWAKIQAVIKECVSAQYLETENMERLDNYDFFISYAHEDKNDFVRPLVQALSNLGLKVWYDEITLEVGDGLRKSIDHGLGNSKYGIVVLSNAFFSKKWPQYELDALVNRSLQGEKVILPIWHGVDHKEVSQYSHSLADKVAFSTASLSIDDMATEFLKIIQRSG